MIKGDCVIPQVMDPVICDGKTFMNIYEARCAGYRDSQCRKSVGSSSGTNDPLWRSIQPQPNGSGGVVSRCPDICDPVIGADGKVYKNECEAQRAGTSAVANALDRSVCGPSIRSEDIMKWLRENSLWVIAALILAILLVRR